jgi:hypothetical protein
LLLADQLGRDGLEKAFIFGLVATTGAVQLFFGYIENYTIMSMGIVLTLYLCVRCLQDGLSPAWPALALALTNAFHPSSIVLWPAMLYLAWRQARQDGLRAWLGIALPVILVFAALCGLMILGGHGPAALLTDDRPGGADSIPFVPLWRVSTEWQHYTMFSAAHLLDWANEHLLISPFGLFLLALLGGTALVRGESQEADANRPDAAGSFLWIASLCYLLLTFVWNPDYGGRQDWDLFAPSAFVYTLLATYLFVRPWSQQTSREFKTFGMSGTREPARLALLLVAVSALHTGVWILFNTIP